MKGRNDDVSVETGDKRRVAHRTRHDWDDPERLSTTLVRAVAAVSGKTLTEIDPLHHVVDVDALDALFAPTRRRPRVGDNSLRLTLEGYDVDVFADGRIEIRAPDTAELY
jgi:hypothetical protein